MPRKKQIKDPFEKREAEKYANPIPSREFILDLFEKTGEPLAYEDVLAALDLKDDDEQEALHRRLIAMVRDGQLVRMRSNKFGLVNKLDLIKGRVMGHPDGHGFLIPEEGGKDLFLSPRQMRLVFDGDIVLSRVARIDHRGRGEGLIVRVLERKQEEIVGRFFIEGGVGFVVPDNKRMPNDIIIPESERLDASSGDIVITKIMTAPTMRTQAVGQIIEILGKDMAPGMETDIAMRTYDLPHTWTSEALNEAKKFPKKVQEADLKNRKDLRDLPFVTIDGEDARDFDDAVYCEKHWRGWTLYVAIADVSYYVKPQAALDEEALKRGNSVYFPSRVIPMLPEELSNELCSLKPKVDRLVLVCQMRITPKGKMSGYEFYPAVIHSNERLTYNNVAAMLVDHDKKLCDQYETILPHLENLYVLYHQLHAYRKKMGTILFEMAEPKVIFDENKKIKSLVPLVRNDAHKLIEECMLCANVAAAEFLLKEKRPGLFRIHPGPKVDKLPEVLTFLNELGLGLKGGLKPTSMDYAKVLEKVENRPDSHLIQIVLLRSLGQAYYSTKNEGHFGLGFDAYTHFTSPIRRYPDLLVHRAIYAILNKKKAKATEEKALENAASHCAITERRADEATREVFSWLKCEFMLDKVGQEFKGVISGVTGFGFFVELEGVFVEGLVHISHLENDYYQFDSVHHQLVGRGTGKVYSIGDPVKIKVARVDLEQKQVDFELLGKKGQKKKSNSKENKKIEKTDKVKKRSRRQK